MIDPKRLDEMRIQIDRLKERQSRAAERLQAIKGRNWYFALLGFESEVEAYTFIVTKDSIPFVHLQRVIEPPREVELASALKPGHLFGAIGRYSGSIKYELVVSTALNSSLPLVFRIAQWVISTLRVRTRAELLVPVVADHSWSTIAALADHSCKAALLEDVPMAAETAGEITIAIDDLDWVSENLISFANLSVMPNFRLAVDSLTTYHMLRGDRMKAAQLWSGIEALFGISQELRFRLALLVATVLEERGPGRLDLYKRVLQLYDVRSKAVHGSPLSADKLKEHTLEVRQLLSRMICAFIETEKLPSVIEIEERLLT